MWRWQARSGGGGETWWRSSPARHPPLAQRLSSSCLSSCPLSTSCPVSTQLIVLCAALYAGGRGVWFCLPEVPEGVLLCMLEAVGVGYCLLEVVEVVELMCCVLLWYAEGRGGYNVETQPEGLEV
jgi:hypothetical protein